MSRKIVFFVFFILPFSLLAEEQLLTPGEFSYFQLEPGSYVEVSALAEKDGDCRLNIEYLKGIITEEVYFVVSHEYVNILTLSAWNLMTIGSDQVYTNKIDIWCTEGGVLRVTH